MKFQIKFALSYELATLSIVSVAKFGRVLCGARDLPSVYQELKSMNLPAEASGCQERFAHNVEVGFTTSNDQAVIRLIEEGFADDRVLHQLYWLATYDYMAFMTVLKD